MPHALHPPRRAAMPGARTAIATLSAAALAVLGGCALELSNRQASQELARQSQPPGSVYIGWRVFQDRCIGCHGADARGTAGAPDLLPRLRQMSSRQFVGLVLTRYDWTAPGVPQGPGRAVSDAQVDDTLARRAPALTMPAWQGEPRVQAHVVDLYAYLAARAEGSVGPGRPAP